MGNGRDLPDEIQRVLVDGLRAHPTTLIFLALCFYWPTPAPRYHLMPEGWYKLDTRGIEGIDHHNPFEHYNALINGRP